MRRLTNTLSALSLLLLLVTIILSLRGLPIHKSMHRVDFVQWCRDPNLCAVASYDGILSIYWYHGNHVSSPPEGWTFKTGESDDDLWRDAWAGFHYSESHFPNPDGSANITRDLRIPLWFISLILAVAPVRKLIALLRTRRQRRWGPYACPNCRYDLRAHKPGEMCPECGTVIIIGPSQS